MARNARCLLSAVRDAELAAKVEEVTRERDALLAQLTHRRNAEAATLTALQQRVETARADVARSEAQLARDAAAVADAERRCGELERGLSPLRRWWARVGQPVLLAAVLVLSIVILLRMNWAKPIAMMLLATFAIGGGLRWWARGAHG